MKKDKPRVGRLHFNPPWELQERALNAVHALGGSVADFLAGALLAHVKAAEDRNGGPFPWRPERVKLRALVQAAGPTVPATTGHRRPKLAQDDSAGRRLAIRLGLIVPAEERRAS